MGPDSTLPAAPAATTPVRGGARLRQQILGANVVLVAVPLLALAIVTGTQFSRYQSARAADDLHKTALALGRQTELYVTAHERGLMVLAGALGGRDLDPADLEARLRDTHAAFDSFLTMLVADKDGRLLARSLPEGMQGAGFTDVSDRPYFIEPMRTGRSYISDVFRGRGFGADPIVAVSAPVLSPDGTPIAIVEGSLNLNRFAELAAAYATTPSMTVVFTDQNDRVIYSNRVGDDFLASVADSPMARSRLQASRDEAVFEFDEGRGAAARRLGSAYTSPRTGWHAYVTQSAADMHRPTRHFYLTTLVVLLLGGVAALLGARAMAGRVTRPLEELVVRAHALEQGGGEAPAVVLAANTPRDVVRLVGDVDGMAGRVAKAKSELEELAASLDRQVRERTAELEHALGRAEAASRAKSEFLSNISHELRTPMNGVLGMAQLLLQTPLSADQRECVTTLHSSGQNLLRLLNEVLDFSRAESGQLAVEHSPVFLLDVVDEVMALVTPSAVQKHLRVHLDADPAAAGTLVTDGTRLRQVLGNILSNAVKFTHEGHVSLELRRGAPVAPGEWIEFRVTDTGIGMTAEELGRVFDPFVQADASTTRRFGGTGLGLAICDRLVRLMGGTLDAVSTPGQGSVFTLRLPATDAASLEAPGRGRLAGRHVEVQGVPEPELRTLAAWLRFWGADTEGVADGGVSASSDHAVVLAGSDGVILASAVADVSRAQRVGPPLRVARLLEVLSGAEEARLPGAATGPERLADRLPFRILVVEDNLVNQKIAVSMLSKLGYDAQVAGDGAEALGLASGGRYDVVLMDLQMPTLDGLEATRRIRASALHPQPWIVALTASAFASTREQCREAGMNDFLAKPLLMTELVAALEGAGRRDAPQSRDGH